MSILDTPRVYFRGQMTWDPIVTNNYPRFYDEATSKPLLDQSVADFREQARLAVTNGNWNPHGTHRSAFFETTVSGVDLGRGLDTSDALVGVPLSYMSMLVDVDPYGTTSSQLFFDDLSVGIDGGSQIYAPSAGPMVARRINFARNSGYTYIAGRASVVWQASFPSGGGLLVHPRGSAVLEALRSMLDDDDTLGLTVRMNTYRTVYYDKQAPTRRDTERLAAGIAEGGFHPNPARSMLVGIVGLWRRDEPGSVPGDRVLARSPGSAVSTAFAKAADKRLTIDLGNSIPETGFDLQKRDLGTLAVVAKTSGGDVGLGSLEPAAYDTAAYLATSGLVELSLDESQADAASGAPLEVRSPEGTPLLTEQPLTVVSESPNLYLDEGDAGSVRLRAYEYGTPPTAPLSISVKEVASPLPAVQVKTDERGNVDVPLTEAPAGTWTWVLVPWRDKAPTPPASLNSATQEYLTVRIMPVDDGIARLAPTWTNVYRHVLRYWWALAPCMDNWLRLDDEQQCAAYAGLLRELTSREHFNRFRYMPVTRDLTNGQRTLLHRWCDAVMCRGEPAGMRAAATRASSPADPADPFGRGF